MQPFIIHNSLTILLSIVKMCPRHFAVIFARVDFSEDEVAEVDRIPLEERDRVAFDCILSRYQTKTGGIAVGIEISG